MKRYTPRSVLAGQRAEAAQIGCSLRTLQKNRLMELPPDARALMIAQIRRLAELKRGKQP